MSERGAAGRIAVGVSGSGSNLRALQARIARGALRRLTYDNDTIAKVTTLVREHSYGEDQEPSALAALLRRLPKR